METERADRNDPMQDTIEQLADFRARSARTINRHQRLVETITHKIGRPQTLLVVIVAAVLWVAFNVAQSMRGHAPIDPAPFFWLQGAFAFCALLTSIMVLTTELRQTHHEDRRAHLDLQINLLAERKIAKLIQLVEELRRDLPNVRNRRDGEAEALGQAMDAASAVEKLNDTFEDDGIA
jgi:uncharacterized membrane protein